MRLGQTWLKIRKNLRIFQKFSYRWSLEKRNDCRDLTKVLFLYPLKTSETFFDLFRGCRNGMLDWNRSWHFNSMFLFYTPLTQRFSGICRGFREGTLTFSWRRPLLYRNQSIDLGSKSMDWFLYDNGLRHEGVKLKWFKSGL